MIFSDCKNLKKFFITDTFLLILEREKLFFLSLDMNASNSLSICVCEKLLEKNIIVILEIDYQGAETVKKQFPQSRNIFVLPPSLDVLEKRLRERGTDEEGVILERMKNARIELSKAKNYDYILENDDFELAEKKLLTYVLDVSMDIDENERKEPLIDKDF